MSRPPPTSYVITLVVGLLILLAFIVGFLLQVLLALVTWPALLCPRGRRLFHFWQSCLFKHIFAIFGVVLNPFWHVKVRFIGDQSGPPKGQGCIMFCNHRSNADPFITAFIQLKGCFEARYVYKGSLAKLPLGGCSLWLADDLAAHFGDKDKIQDMLEQARCLLKEGGRIVVFPEGTRSPSGILQDFKPTFFAMCAELGCPAVPACVIGTERAWPLSGSLMGCATVRAAVGEPIQPGLGGGAELAVAVRAAMQQLAEDLVESDDEDVLEDPLLSGKPYPYWNPPADMAHFGQAELMKLLREGRSHDRGKRLL